MGADDQIPEDSLLLPADEWRAALEAIRTRRRVLERHEDAAEALERGGDADGAIAIAGAAAAIAGTQHPGVQGSPRLEAVLERIAAARLGELTRPEPDAGGRRVLHVVSEVYEVGGHTRVLWRWMDRERGSRHTIVATSHRGAVPGRLVEVARASGGDFTALDLEASPLDRAAELRRFAAAADVVVVHHHPPDPIPALALGAAPERPPVVIFNHADHMFWLGAAVCDVLLSIRAVGADVGRTGRAIPAERHIVRPFPVSGDDANGHDPAEPVGDDERAAARADLFGRLGWPDDAVVLATVGSPFKYEGPPGSRLVDLVQPLMDEFPAVRLVGAGPRDEGSWQEGRLRTEGRVIALGELADVSPVLLAGDVYLDSRPQGGQSSAAEAAAVGLPAVSYAASAMEAALVCPDPLYGATVLHSLADYQRELRRLIADAAARRAAGEEARRVVAAADAGWDAAVADAYALAQRLGPLSAAGLTPLADEARPREAVVYRALMLHRNLTQQRLGWLDAVVELGARSPAVRRLFRWVTPGEGFPEQHSRYGAVFAAPPAEPSVLTAVIDEFRRLARIPVAARYVMALRPEDADAAVPVLEAALAAGEDVDVDLELAPDPAAVRPPGSLEIVTELPRDGALGEHQHPIAGLAR
jgi:hypothetical protein